MAAEKLLAKLRSEPMARLRHAILREAGIPPFSMRRAFISNRQVLRYACHLALDRENDAAAGEGEFDMVRFAEMKEAEHGGI